MAECRIDYVELPSRDGAATRRFFETAFAWRTLDYGPSYFAFDKATSGLDGGVASGEDRTAAPMVILKTADLDAALAAVRAAGGVITRGIFAFPGGRRFHFLEPGGAEMAVWAEPEATAD